MQFRVPQFIDVEDKIFGPFTFKQFIYVLGAGGSVFLAWALLQSKTLAILVSSPLVGLFLSLAFVKINERPFIDFLESVFRHFTKTREFTWQQPEVKVEGDLVPLVVTTTKEATVEKSIKGKLRDVAFGLDVYDRNPQEEATTSEK